MRLEDIPITEEEIQKYYDDSQVKKIKTVVAELPDITEDVHTFGFPTFEDAMEGGFEGGDLVIMSGATAQGKTTFGQTITCKFLEDKIPCLWFSYEMAIRQIWKKFQSMEVEPDSLLYTPQRIASGNIDWIEQKIKEGILKYKTKMIFIDHLGFLAPSIKELKNANNNYAIYLTSICRTLKQLAVRYEIIIFLIAHTRKTDKEVDINDIAYSSGIVQEADFVFLIEREKRLRGEKEFFSGSDIYTTRTLIKLAKNRRTGLAKMVNARFLNYKLMEVPNEIQVKDINFNKK